jgi:protein-tyrosine phosphatase
MAVVGELHVSFVCTGNTCRSPMAEKIFAEHLDRAGLADQVRVSSAGTTAWHAGDDADPRTTSTLRRHGYPIGHVAAIFGDEHREADLLIALDTGHERELARMGVPSDRRRLLRSFDPTADGPSVPDPYYGSTADYELVREQIEAAIPGLLDWVQSTLTARADEPVPASAEPSGLDTASLLDAEPVPDGRP